MKIEDLRVRMKVRHPVYGEGEVKSIGEKTASALFNEGLKEFAPEACGLQPSEAEAAITGLQLPLERVIRQAVTEAVYALGIEMPDESVELLGKKWNDGRLVMHPNDPTLQTKEIPVETFFHKIVMLRNNLRVLEQKVNANEGLNDGDKVELQQYISRCYGSLTSFNILFKDKDDQFSSK